MTHWTRAWISSGAGRRTGIGAGRFIEWLDITASKFSDWRERYGMVNEHNGWVPRDFLAAGGEQAIIGFHLKPTGRQQAADVQPKFWRRRESSTTFVDGSPPVE